MLAKDFRPSCPLKSARTDATSLLCFACRGRPRQLLLHSSRARTVSQMTLRWQIDFQHSLRSAENRQLPRTTRPRLRLSLARSERWYSAFVQKIVTQKSSIVDKFGPENYLTIFARYSGYLTAIRQKQLGGCILTADAVAK